MNEWLIEHASILTMNADRDILFDSSIGIRGDRIEFIGGFEEGRKLFPDANQIDATGKVVLPGLINSHTHLAMSLQKGITLAIPDALFRVMWPVEKHLTAEDVYIGSLAGGAEALLGGTTTVVDHYFFAEQTAKAVIELGLRAVVGHTIISSLGPITGINELNEGLDFIVRWKGKNPLVIPCLAPHATNTVSEEWLKQLRQAATDEGVRLHLHLAQNLQEQQYIQEKFNKGCVEYLADMGFLQEDVLAAHCINISDSEMDLLAKTGAYQIFCPMSHALNGTVAQSWKMLAKGVNVLIATDCVTSNNEMNLLSELRIAGASQKQLACDPNVFSSQEILEMVTTKAAAAIGMGDCLGSLAPGYFADLIILNYGRLFSAPSYSLVDNIVYCCNGRDVETVFVNGKMVVQEGKLVNVKEGELVKQINSQGNKLIKTAVSQDEELSKLFG